MAQVPHVLFFLFLALAATLFALVEIQIEGPIGWAENLPTWKVINRWTRLFYGSRPLTGYHLYIQLFILTIVHLPLALNLAAFSWRTESRVLCFVTLFWVLEDFLWFILNPVFGLKRFRPECIWWHAPAWWWIMPRDYWIFIPVGIILYSLSL